MWYSGSTFLLENEWRGLAYILYLKRERRNGGYGYLFWLARMEGDYDNFLSATVETGWSSAGRELSTS